MFKHYVDNEQFNLQINRFINDEYENNPSVQQDLKMIIPNLTDTESWYQLWLERAQYREKLNDDAIAATYYQAAEFYLDQQDPRSEAAYQKYRDLFYRSYKDFKYESYQVPYEDHYLPVTKLINPNATKNLIMFAGYDSYMEEMIKSAKYLKGIDYNIYVLDGPGQGTALRNGLHLIHNWEKPVSTIIDYFDFNKVSVIGVSLGGYLVMRAAAFDKRIDKIVAFDIFYSIMDTLTMRMPQDLTAKINMLLDSHQAIEVNELFQNLMAQNIDLKWKINKGMENTGTSSPYDLLISFKKYTVKNILSLVNQEVLLLAGENDQYVPSSRLVDIEKGLINAGKVSSILFSKESGGDQHCQAGHRELGFNAIKSFLA